LFHQVCHRSHLIIFFTQTHRNIDTVLRYFILTCFPFSRDAGDGISMPTMASIR
jgi:hypothetical protein